MRTRNMNLYKFGRNIMPSVKTQKRTRAPQNVKSRDSSLCLDFHATSIAGKERTKRTRQKKLRFSDKKRQPVAILMQLVAISIPIMKSAS